MKAQGGARAAGGLEARSEARRGSWAATDMGQREPQTTLSAHSGEPSPRCQRWGLGRSRQCPRAHLPVADLLWTRAGRQTPLETVLKLPRVQEM